MSTVPHWVATHIPLIVVLVILWGGTVLEMIAAPFRHAGEALARRRRHQVKLRRLDLQIEKARTGQPSPALKDPGPCKHRNVVSVRSESDGQVVAWLCRSCDTQLPADWAVSEEDL